jgi:hypothetical protein
LTEATTTEPLTIESVFPEYLVPTHTTAFSESASTSGSQPIEFDSASPAGDPDVGSTAGSTAGASFTAPEISQGLWDIAPVEVGSWGSTGGPSETVTTSMSVTTAAFDPSVSSSTGDLWAASAGGFPALETVEPVIVNPGQSATIPVTITPSAAPGSTVSGTLYVDEANLLLYEYFFEPNGNEVAAIPYSYTVR